MISTELSVLPPSITRYSRLGYPCKRMDRIVSSKNLAWLKDGVTMLIRGHACPSGMECNDGVLSSVHGQPCRPGGGSGRSFSLGQRIADKLSVLERQFAKNSVAAPETKRPSCGGLREREIWLQSQNTLWLGSHLSSGGVGHWVSLYPTRFFL